MIEPIPAYAFKAKYLGNHDGDNVWLALDHGKFPTSRAVTECEIRLKDVYCPELNKPGGVEARDFVAATLFDAGRITAQTYKPSFARTMADVWVDGRLLSELIIEAGHGTKEKPA